MNHILISQIKAGESYLEELLKNNADVKAVFTKLNNKAPDKAEFKFKNLYEVDSLNNSKKLLKEYEPDVLWVLGWSEILDKETLSIPKIGSIGSHPTKLPKYRGRAPLAWTILKGLEKSALTFLWLNEGIDTGDILCQKDFDVKPNDNSTTLYEKMVGLGKEIIREYLPLIEKNKAPRIKQNPAEFIEYWKGRTYKDQEIDFSKPAKEIDKLIRASHLYKGAYFYKDGKKITIWKATIEEK